MSLGADLDASIQAIQDRINAVQPSGAAVVSSFGFTGFKKLKIACRPGTNTYEISFDGCILKDAAGGLIQHGSASIVVNPTVSGLNGLDVGVLSAANSGWYEIHVISDGVAPKAVLSKNAPLTLPSGYTYSEFAGYAQVFSVSPLDLSQSLQYDDTVSMQARGALPSTGVAATAANTPQTLNAAAYIPPKARFVSGMMGAAQSRRLMMAVMAWDYNQGIPSDIGRRNANGPAWGPGDGFGITENFENLPIENQTMYWKSADTQDSNILYLTGYRI